MRCGLFVLLLVAELIAPGVCEASSTAGSSEVSNLLMRSRWSHEPEPVIRQAVQILDRQLDEDSTNKNAWLQLAESLSIGLVHSRHADAAIDAWRHAYELDATDCHTGALATPFGDGTESERKNWIQKLGEEQPHCAEVVFLKALISEDGSKERTSFLRESLALKESSDALVLLAMELTAAGNWKEGEQDYLAALKSLPLFPEDWRPDGRVAVHAHLGLAWSYYSRGKMTLARREFKRFSDWYDEPGPWHDLSQREAEWLKKLESVLSYNTNLRTRN
jgi:tetratricopeptide (TPR) repeat protein